MRESYQPGNPLVDFATLRQVRVQLGMMPAPLGPTRALTPDGTEVDYVDLSDFSPNDLDPNAPVINPGEDYTGRRRYPPQYGGGSLENPYIEALYPEGADDWSAPTFDPTSPPESPRPPDPAATVAFSAGVRSPTIHLSAASAGHRMRSSR
jgi:hypothetical protein